jgi:transposase
MSQKLNSSIAVVGIDIGKNSFHVVGYDQRGAIVLRQKWSRGQVETRLANLSPCLIGMEACVGAHHLSRKLQMLGHDARLMPAKYMRPYSKGHRALLPRQARVPVADLSVKKYRLAVLRARGCAMATA